MKRREFITLLGGAAAWPIAARAQQPEGMRRLAIIMLTADDADGQACITALREGLEKLGWTAHNGTWQCAPRTNYPPCRKPLLEAPPDGTAREPR